MVKPLPQTILAKMLKYFSHSMHYLGHSPEIKSIQRSLLKMGRICVQRPSSVLIGLTKTSEFLWVGDPIAQFSTTKCFEQSLYEGWQGWQVLV